MMKKIENIFFVKTGSAIFLSFILSFLSFLSVPMSSFTTPFEEFTYLPHQIEALHWMIAREDECAEHVRGGILADEMGLGKTWMTIGLLLNAVVPNTLLIVPPVLQSQWGNALKKSNISYRILGPPKQNESGSWLTHIGTSSSSCMVTLATYDRAYTKVDYLLSDRTYDRIVCDEGHVLRNGPALRRFSELMRIGAARRWILSGTPIQNKKNDFMNLVQFLGMDDAKRIKSVLNEVAQVIILRRTVHDVREFVPAMPTIKPIHCVHPVVMPKGSEEETVFLALVRRLEHAVEVHAQMMIVLELYLRIRQFMAHPDIYVQALRKKYQDLYKREIWTGTASKMEAFRTFLKESPKTPTIVFATFKKEMDYAEVALRENGYSVYSIRGGMSDSQREFATQESKKLAEEGKPVAIVVQIIAGGAGLNLQHCSRVVFLSSHWNPAVVDQAIARAYRMGQTKTVEVHHFMIASGAEKNIDRLMAKLHSEKREIATTIHEKLYCDSAIDTNSVLAELDSVATDMDDIDS